MFFLPSKRNKTISDTKYFSNTSKHDNRAYCFLGWLVFCQNIQNPTYGELQEEEGKKAVSLQYTSQILPGTG